MAQHSKFYLFQIFIWQTVYEIKRVRGPRSKVQDPSWGDELLLSFLLWETPRLRDCSPSFSWNSLEKSILLGIIWKPRLTSSPQIPFKWNNLQPIFRHSLTFSFPSHFSIESSQELSISLHLKLVEFFHFISKVKCSSSISHKVIHIYFEAFRDNWASIIRL